MLKAIFEDNVEVVDAENNPPFSLEYDYGAITETKKNATKKWNTLSPEERVGTGCDFKQFQINEGVVGYTDAALYSSKNYYLLKNEVAKRLECSNVLQILPINEINIEQALLELVENMENIEHIKELYKLRKKSVGDSKNAGITTAESARLRNCIRQGRELYLSGKNGTLMVKPLNFFYSLTAYAYAEIILNNPIRYTLDALPGSHGINYIPDGVKVQFGGDMPHGTFSDLFCAFPTLLTKNKNIEVVQDNTASLLAFFKIRNTTNIGTLLSMIPEVREYYRLITGNRSRTHPLEILVSSDPRKVIWEFQIGDGETKPDQNDVVRSFDGFKVSDRHGKFVVEVPAIDSHKIKASMYVDSRGEFWYIENPFFPVILPEVCIHFLLTNTFSNIMRYSPDNWGSILFNEVDSDVSLITRKYLSAFENKMPILMLRSISKYYPYVLQS